MTALGVSVSFLCDSPEGIYISIAAFSMRLYDKEQGECFPRFECMNCVVYICQVYCIGSLTECLKRTISQACKRLLRGCIKKNQILNMSVA